MANGGNNQGQPEQSATPEPKVTKTQRGLQHKILRRNSERCKWFIGAFTFLFLFSYDKIDTKWIQITSFVIAILGSSLLAIASLGFRKDADTLEHALDCDDPAHTNREEPIANQIQPVDLFLYRAMVGLLCLYVLLIGYGLLCEEKTKSEKTNNIIIYYSPTNDTNRLAPDTLIQSDTP